MSKLTEANVNLSINDLNSSDMQALSQILSLAGQAESSGMGSGMGMAPEDDLGSYDGLSSMSGPDGDMSSDVGSIDMGTTPAPFDMGMDLGLDDPMGGEEEPMGMEMGDEEPMDMEMDLGAEPGAEPGADEPMGMEMPMNDDPIDTVDGFDDDMDADVDLGLEDEGDMEPMDMEMMEQFTRMFKLAGLNESEEAVMDEEVIEEAEEDEEDMLDEGVEPEVEDEPAEEIGDDAEEPVWLRDIPSDKDAGTKPAEPKEQAPTWMRESMNAISTIVEGEETFDDSEFDEDEDDEQLDENEHGLYNLDLDEDAVEEMASPGIGDNRVFGPYQNELACMTDARKEIPGAMRDREVKLTHKPDGFYWSKLQQEDATNSRPKIQDVCTKGIKSDKHEVDMLAAKLNEQFARFLKGE